MSLTVAERARLRELDERLSGARNERRLEAEWEGFWGPVGRPYPPLPSTDVVNAADAIHAAHLARVQGRSSPAACDEAVARALA